MVGINHGGAALLIGLLLNHDQPMGYLTGLAVHRTSGTYRGEGKADAKDAFVIADQARMRHDLGLLRPGDAIAVDLRILTTRRTDLACDRTRQINRLRAQLLEFFPALERALDLTNKGPVILLTGYQPPAAIRRTGAKRSPLDLYSDAWAPVLSREGHPGARRSRTGPGRRPRHHDPAGRASPWARRSRTARSDPQSL